MIKDSSKRLLDVVIVWKLDRFARNRYDSAHYKAILRKNGVKVISATEKIAEDSTGVLLESLLEGYAEFYSAELSEKVVRGMKENALKGKYNGGGMPLGYVVDSDQYFQVDPLTAPMVLKAFTMYADGGTIRGVTNMLNEKGVRTNRDKPMSINSVTRLLHNRKYIGEYKYRDIVDPDGIPAIVPVELFEKVQERLSKTKKAPARFKSKEEGGYLLTTKLFCGRCGAFMVGESGTSRTMKVHHYYKCVTAKNKKTCKKKSVKKDWIENLVIDQIVGLLFNDMAIQTIVRMVMDLQKRENISLPLLKKQLAETSKNIDNMFNAIQQGMLTSSAKQNLEELEEMKSNPEASILQEEMEKPFLSEEQITFWLHKFRDGDTEKPEHRQRLIDRLCKYNNLYDDKIVPTFNYKDGSKTISLADVEGSDLDAFGAPAASHRRQFTHSLQWVSLFLLPAIITSVHSVKTNLQ